MQHSVACLQCTCCMTASLAWPLFTNCDVYAASVRPRGRELDSFNSLPSSRVLRSSAAANGGGEGGQAMQSVQMATPSSTFRDLYPTSSANYGSRTHLNPITGQLSAIGSVYTRSTSASRQPQELTTALDRPLTQKSSTSSPTKSGQFSQGLRSMSIDRLASQATSSLRAAHSTRQATTPHTTSQLPQHRPVSDSHDKYTRPSRLAVAPASSSSSSSSSSAESEASSPADRTAQGRRFHTGKGSSVSLAAGIKSLSMQLSSPSSSQGTPTGAAHQSSSANAVLSRYLLQTAEVLSADAVECAAGLCKASSW